jgi:hypothetical protein
LRRKSYDEELLKKLKRQEERGILYEALTKEIEPPYFKMPLKRPEETENDWHALLSWSDYWHHPVKDTNGRPLWHIEEKGKNTKSFGRQTLPVRVFVDTPEDAFAILGMKKEKKEFLTMLGEVEEKADDLTEWFLHYFPRIREEGFYPLFFGIAHFFREQEEKGGYLREISIPGVDTKFMERHSFLVRTLWNALFPDKQVESNEEMKQHLFIKEVPAPTICARSLDESIRFFGVRKFFLSNDEVASFHPPQKRIFITENKVNGYTFPHAKDSLILFGMGYGVLELAKEAKWLGEKDVYYWGDLDSDGFNILSSLRHILPNVHSFLMDRDTLLAYVDKRIKDTGNRSVVPDNLTVTEKMAWKEIHDHGWRLEQERIPLDEVEWALEQMD